MLFIQTAGSVRSSEASLLLSQLSLSPRLHWPIYKLYLTAIDENRLPHCPTLAASTHNDDNYCMTASCFKSSRGFDTSCVFLEDQLTLYVFSSLPPCLSLLWAVSDDVTSINFIIPPNHNHTNCHHCLAGIEAILRYRYIPYYHPTLIRSLLEIWLTMSYHNTHLYSAIKLNHIIWQQVNAGCFHTSSSSSSRRTWGVPKPAQWRSGSWVFLWVSSHWDKPGTPQPGSCSSTLLSAV